MPSFKQMKLGDFLYSTGHHGAGWRHPEATTEREKFDLIVTADGNSSTTVSE